MVKPEDADWRRAGVLLGLLAAGYSRIICLLTCRPIPGEASMDGAILAVANEGEPGRGTLVVRSTPFILFSGTWICLAPKTPVLAQESISSKDEARLVLNSCRMD